MTINYSIVLPTYNCNFIERSIDSIIKQTHKNWELIVIDNFSKNNVRKIIESKNDKRIRYFRYKNKGIIAKSRNLGIKIAKFNSHLGTGDVINTNYCKISVCNNRKDNNVIIVSAIDNLIKGASGQAVQNMNVAFKLNEKVGII